MKQLKYIFIYFLVFFLIQDKALSQYIPEAYQIINEDAIKKSAGFEYLRDITTNIGHRYTGSANGYKAEDYTYNLYKKLGYEEVQKQEFEFTTWVRGELRFAYYGNKYLSRKRDVQAFAYMNTVDNAEINCGIVDAHYGLKKDIEGLGEKIKDKAVLIDLNFVTSDTSVKNNSFREKLQLSENAGAKAIILIDNNTKGYIVAGLIPKNLLKIPVIKISCFSGEVLKRQILKKKQVNIILKMSNYSGKVKANNIIATLKGNEIPDEYIIIGGHLDSWDLATGAMDNGTGTTQVMDLARLFKSVDLKNKRTLKFINFMGEEQGLHGSRAYVKMLKETGEIDKVKVFINMDITGNPKGYITNSDKHKLLVDSIGKIFNQIDTVFKNKNNTDIGTHTDHQPFMVEGVPVFRPVHGLHLKRPDCYHSTADSFDNIDKQDMINQNRFTGMLMYYFANLPELPANFTSEETKDLMIKFKLKDILINFGDWKW